MNHVKNCPRCGRLVQSDSALFCPYCAMTLAPPQTSQVHAKRTAFRTAAGILTTIGASISIIYGIVALILLVMLPAYYYGVSSNMYVISLLLMMIFGFLGFAFGLTSGIFSLKRKKLTIIILGISLLVVSGLVTIVAISISIVTRSLFMFGLLCGLPIIILSILSIIFVGISKHEFV